MISKQEAVAQLANEYYSYQQYKPAWDRANVMLEKMTQDEIDNFFTTFAEDNPILQFTNEALEAARSQVGEIKYDFADVLSPLMDKDELGSITEGIEVVFTDYVPEAIRDSTDGVASAAGDVATTAASVFKDSFTSSFDENWIGEIFEWKSMGSDRTAYKTGQEAWSALRSAYNTGEIDYSTYMRNAENLTSVLSDVTKPMKENGEEGAFYLLEGWNQTIRGGKPYIYKTAEDSFGAAPDAVFKVLDENSPSKLSQEQAEYYIIGFCNGLEKMAERLKVTSEETAQIAVDSFSGIMTSLDRVFSGNLDVQPVISPVLDLTSVTSAAGQLNGMLDMSASYNMAVQAYTEAEEARASRERALAQMVIDGVGAHLAGIGASLDDLRDVVESHGDSDLVIDVNVDGAALARMTVNDYLYASRANGTPFYEANLFSSL